ncbi:MAG: GNAT family N-acetyltransferase [Fimbriimonadaceae bacterium]|nr:GNAT family N-acetyltransferase [Fimbriimonadaceae bacterium]QYK57902.1 MAG: GNAT family N-acetyltransferase [Fimbriimonadaceae bacterium]
MTVRQSLGRENVLATYGELARHVPGTALGEFRGCLVARGELPVSFSNFVAGFDWPAERADAWIDELLAVVVKQPVLWLFVDSDDMPADLESRLRDRGATVRQTLVHMVSTGDALDADALDEMSGHAERVRVAELMTEEFFGSSSLPIKRAVAVATADSSHDLLARSEEGELVGAVMVSRTTRTLGIYNLCVRPDWRGRGIGSSMVRAVLSLARSERRQVVLQCERRLVPWYFNLGFKECGDIRALALPKGPVWDYNRTSWARN